MGHREELQKRLDDTQENVKKNPDYFEPQQCFNNPVATDMDKIFELIRSRMKQFAEWYAENDDIPDTGNSKNVDEWLEYWENNVEIKE